MFSVYLKTNKKNGKSFKPACLLALEDTQKNVAKYTKKMWLNIKSKNTNPCKGLKYADYCRGIGGQFDFWGVLMYNYIKDKEKNN